MLSEQERQEIEEELAHLPTPEAGCIDALRIVQEHRGYVSDEALGDLAPLLHMTPAELDHVATFYNLIFRRPVGRHVILVCDSVSCWVTGQEGVSAHLQRKLGIEAGQTTPDGTFTLLPTVCLGHCEQAPVMMLDGSIVGNLTEEVIDRVLAEAAALGEGGKWEPVLTRNIVAGRGPTSLADYEKGSGYQALRHALKMSPAELVKLAGDAGLRGRGGAGFPTGFKWGALPPIEKSQRPRYFVCNFDEMEPGTFKDRYLVEGDPHQLIEGLMIAAWACQADVGYIFIRGEYLRPRETLRAALSEAEARGYIGKNALGSGRDFPLHLHVSAGRYICGEETGLLNALEGKPANPRSKPPYPQSSGAWGKPTVVQNVETLCCLPHIVARGAEWFKGLGKAQDAGMKMYGVSGKVRNPGCWEMPIGTTLRELIEGKAGGMRDGYAFRAALPGGASTRFLGEENLDVPLEYASLKDIGAFFGTGTAIVLDDKTCPVAMVRNLQMFYARESCGWCTPCREGLPWVHSVLQDLEEGRGGPEDVELLLDLGKSIGPNTYCAFALGAVQPLLSGLERFRGDFDEHAREGRCRYRTQAHADGVH